MSSGRRKERRVLQLTGWTADDSDVMVERALVTTFIAVGMIVLLTLMQHMVSV